jgi:hypothetical protein
MDEKRYEQAMELMKDKEFFKELASQESPEAAQKLFESKGVQLSTAEIKDMRDAFVLVFMSDNSELSDEQLEGVAGGSKIGDWFKKAWEKVDNFMDKTTNDVVDKVIHNEVMYKFDDFLRRW